MSSRLKKKDSPTSLAFDEDAIPILSQAVVGEDGGTYFREVAMNILYCKSNGKDQLQYVKELTKHLKTECNIQSLEFICQMFIHCKSKHPLRRTLAGFVTSLDEENSVLFISSMSNILCDALTEKKIQQSSAGKDFHVHLQERVELVLSLMENFSKGDQVVGKNFSEIFIFLGHALQTFVELSRTNDGPVFQTKMIHAVLVVFKTVIGVLQKCEKYENKVMEPTFKEIIKTSLDVTTDGDFLIECRNAAAMVLPAILLHFPMELDVAFSCICGYTNVIENDSFAYQISCEIKKLFDSEKYSTVIVLLHAILVKLLPSALVNRNITFYRDVFLERLKTICSKSSDKNTLVLAFKTFSVWINSYKEFLEISGDEGGLEILLANDIVPFLITYADHGIDTIRHSVTTSLKECFNVLSKANVKLLDELGRIYFASDLKSRGKISILTSLCEFSDMNSLLRIRPTFPGEVIGLLSDVDLASHAANLYKFASLKHLNELRDNDKCSSLKWKVVWIDSMASELLGSCKDTKVNLTNLIVPNILKVNAGVMRDVLLEVQENPSISNFYTAVVFLKSARSMKNISQDEFQIPLTSQVTSSSNKAKWKGIFNLEMLDTLIVDGNDQVRLDVLSLICCPVKTTDHIEENDVQLIKTFLKYNMAVENPAFRQQTVNCLKRFFVRIFSHSYQITKSKHVTRDKTNQLYGQFLAWFVSYIFRMLHLKAPYCQVSFTLELVSIITDFFIEHLGSEVMKNVEISESEKNGNTKRLLECLHDTYDPNRLIVLSIFKKNPIFCNKVSKKQLQDVLVDAWSKLFSPQPDISSIAAYQLCFVSISLSECNADVLKPLHKKETSPYEDPFVDLLNLLYQLLLDQLIVMKTSLVKASQNGPVHGVLFTLRLLFQVHKLDLKSLVVNKHKIFFAKFVNEFIKTGLAIIDLVSPYVTNEAPEGQLCNVNLSDLFDLLQVGEKGTDDIVLQAHIARMILVCCWRSMKEVSLLLGTFVSNFSSCSKQQNILSDDILTDMWIMFSNIMLRSKHAGAYELASVGFIKLCTTLWISPSEVLRNLPLNAVKDLVSDLVSENPLENAQVTRRSAGLPFYLQSICSTEPEINAKGSFNHLMSSLTELYLTKPETHDINKLVISLNVLRAFFKDAKMSEDVFPYISQAVTIALNGFGSALWPIRNSCTLLFSTLMQRIFGVKKFKMTGREFFSRYPQLYPFLVKQTRNMLVTSEEDRKHGTDLHPSVFPILLLLSQLYPSTVEGTDSLIKLDVFKNAIMRLGSNAVYKTRIMAANALIPLVPLEKTEEFVRLIVQNIDQYQHHDKSNMNTQQNLIHGNLLQLKMLLSKWFTTLQGNSGFLALVIYIIEHSVWLTQSHVISSHSKKVIIDILVFFLRKGYISADNTALLEKHIKSGVMYFQKRHQSEQPNAGHSLLLRSTTAFFLELLKSPFWQEILLNIFNESGHDISNPSNVVTLMIRSNVMEVITELLKNFEDITNSVKFSNEFINDLFEIISKSSPSKAKFPKLVNILVWILEKEEEDIDTKKLISLYEQCTRKDIASQREEEILCTLSVFSILVKQEKFKTAELLSQEEHSDMWRYINMCTAPIQSTAVRLKVKDLLNTSYCLDVNKDIYRLFDSVVNLLNDCEVDVRIGASEAIYASMFPKGQPGELISIPQPRYVFEKFVNVMLAKRLMADTCGCLLYLVCLCNHDYMFDKMNESNFERDGHTENETFYKPFVVFEQGKENPYWDDEFIRTTIIELVQRQLSEATLPSAGTEVEELKIYLRKSKHFEDEHVRKLVQSIEKHLV